MALTNYLKMQRPLIGILGILTVIKCISSSDEGYARAVPAAEQQAQPNFFSAKANTKNLLSPKASLASSYPNDAGIENDPDVLFVEKFEGELNKITSRYDDVKNREGMSLTTDVPTGSAASHSLKITNIGGVNDGGHLLRQLRPGYDGTVFLRYYVKYPSVSKGFIHHEGVWLGGYNPSIAYPHPRAGTCGLGSERISIAYEPVTGPAMDPYLYWGEMKSWNGGSSCYGNDMVNGSPTAKNLSWDKWMCVEVMVKLNQPVTSSNGELRIWQDGVEVGHWGTGFPNGHWKTDSWFNHPDSLPFPGFRWRTDPRLNINYVWIEFYDDKSPQGAIHHINFSNLVMARRYIGPISH